MSLERGCGDLPQPGRRRTARRRASRRRSSAKAAERVRPVGEEGQAVGDAGARVSIAMVVLTGTDWDAAMWGALARGGGREEVMGIGRRRRDLAEEGGKLAGGSRCGIMRSRKEHPV